MNDQANSPKRRPFIDAVDVNKWHRAAMRAVGDNEARRKWTDSKAGSPVVVMFLCEDVSRLQIERAEMLAALQAVVAVADRKTVEFDMARAAIAKAEGSPIQTAERTKP